MQRRHEHLDAFRVDDAHAVEQVLLREDLRRRRTLGRAAGELVDQLVDPGRADCAGRSADDHLPPGELHQAGLITTSERELALQVADDLVVGQRRGDVLRERVERPALAPEQHRVPRIHVLVRAGVERAR